MIRPKAHATNIITHRWLDGFYTALSCFFCNQSLEMVLLMNDIVTSDLIDHHLLSLVQKQWL